MPIGIGLAIAGIAGAGASLFGAGAQVSAEQKAIQAQQAMYRQGLQTQKQYVGEAAGALDPYMQAGGSALDYYNYLTGVGPSPTGAGPSYTPLTAPLTAPFTAASLPYTPGYEFTLGQGLLAAQSGFAAQGLGTSGPAMRGAADYTTGLAQSTYNQQLQNYLMQNQQIANLLMGPAQIGAGAAGTLAGIYGGAGQAALSGATQTGAGVASGLAGIGNALAGGAAGVSGALSNNLLMYAMLNRMAPGAAAGAGAGAGAPSYVQNALMSQGAVPYMGGPYQAAYPTG